jgi:small-conductance mechanosensitive channel
MADYVQKLRNDLVEQFKGKPVIDALMEAVGAAFDAHGVSMSYPQMNVHVLDTPESAKKD